jgi:hypothetical protein
MNHQEIIDLMNEAARLRTALEFYADPRRYEGPNTNPIPNDPYQPEELVYRLDIIRDGGQIARNALKQGE